MTMKILYGAAALGLLLTQPIAGLAQDSAAQRRHLQNEAAPDARGAPGAETGVEQGRRTPPPAGSDRMNSGNAGSSPRDHQTNQANPGPYAPR